MQQYRTIAFNLKDPKNPDFRKAVVGGNISPDRMATMTSEEMASKVQKQIFGMLNNKQ